MFRQIIKEILKLKSIEEVKETIIPMIAKLSDDPCELCEHHQECKGKDCPDFISGTEGILDGKPVKLHWTCEDFTYGECTKLEHTPCFDCWKYDFQNFKFNEKLDLG